MLRAVTNTDFSSSNGGLSYLDPEKGAASEPSSDATAVEGFKRPNDSTAKGWRWSRNDSDSTAVPLNPRPQPAQGVRQTEKERARKYRTWYSAAADIVPEIDFASRRPSRPVIDAAEIPRYRDDDVADVAEKPLPEPPPKEADRPKTERGEDRLEVWQQRHSDALRAARRNGGAPAKSKASSQRSSWGTRRDKWDLMPSVVYWDKGGLSAALDSR